MRHSAKTNTQQQSSQQATASTSYQHEETEQEEEEEEEEEVAFIEQVINSTAYMTPKELLDRIDGASFERWAIYNERANEIDDSINEAKDKLYAEKLEQFKKELSELEAGTHPALCEKLKALEHERDQQLFRINTIAQTRVKHVDNQYELERTMAQEELDTGKRYLRNAWKSYLDDNGDVSSTDELLPRKKRKEMSPRPVLQILKDKIGMMNSVTNRRQAADRLRMKKDRCDSLDTHDENELHTDLLVMRRIVDTHEGYQRSRKPAATSASSTGSSSSSKRHQQHDTNASTIRRS